MSLPRIRSEARAFDLHHPEIALMEYPANVVTPQGHLIDAGEDTGRQALLKERADKLEGDNS